MPGSNPRFTRRNASYTTRPEHLPVPLAPHKAASPCSPLKLAAELQHEVGHVLHDLPHRPRRPLLRGCSARGGCAEQPTARVPVEGAVGAVAVEDFAEPGGELRQAFRRRPPRPRTKVTGFASPGMPNRSGTARARERPRAGRAWPASIAGTCRRDEARPRQTRRSSSWNAVRHVRRVVGTELDHQQGFRGRPRIAAIVSFSEPLCARGVDEHAVHQFDRRRAEFQTQLERVEPRGSSDSNCGTSSPRYFGRRHRSRVPPPRLLQACPHEPTRQGTSDFGERGA